jgi:NarL family two-component system response regulator YdfI
MDRRATRVLVVADSGVSAARLEALLRGDPSLRVQVGTLAALGRLIEDHPPTVVVLASTAARAIAALEAVADTTPLPPVVLLVETPRVAWTAAARRAGVRAVLDDRAGREEIAAAVAAATAGLITLHPDVVDSRPHPATSPETDAERTLTPRELEILESLAEGLTNQAIAHRLHISTYTVKFHVAAVLAKLHAGSRTEAVTLGLRRGLISL